MWPDIKAGNVVSTVSSTMKCLGYYLACNGDTSEQKAKCLGSLRGALSKQTKVLKHPWVPSFLIARWWRMQINGVLGFAAPFLVPTQRLVKDFTVIANRGARLIGKLPNNFNIALRLQMIKDDFSVDVPIMYLKFLVNRVTHVFRHEDLPIYKFFSLPRSSRLREQRMQGSRYSLSASRMNSWRLLESLGLNAFGPPVAGRPGIRGEAGCVIRWGEGWFEEVHERLGWRVPRKDHVASQDRVEILKSLFAPPPSRLQALRDRQLALTDN